MNGEDAMKALVAHERDAAWKRDYDAAWKMIQHFTDDAYIRVKEPSYDETQRRNMENLAKRLER